MKKVAVSEKTKNFINGATSWVGAGVVMFGAYFGNFSAELCASITATVAAVITIENIWLTSVPKGLDKYVK